MGRCSREDGTDLEGVREDATRVDGRKHRTAEAGACLACPRNNQKPLQLRQRREKADSGSRVLEGQ